MAANNLFIASSMPDAFSYILALELVIIALGITKILEGVVWIIANRRTVETYWIHTLCVVLIGLLQLKYAWSSFQDFEIRKWTFLDFILNCSTPMIYLFAAGLLFHETKNERLKLEAVHKSEIKLVAGL